MPHSAYVVKSVMHASQVLTAFRTDREVLGLRDVVARTGLKKGMCFRLLYTLHLCGFVEKAGPNQYRAVSEQRPHRRLRIGYAGQGQDTSFPREVGASLAQAAAAAHVELVVLDNRYNARTALRNADQLVREEVDLAVQFQSDESVAPEIARKLLGANIPFIAIDIPHPGATYFGANNYEAGLIGGRHLGRWARKNWTNGPDPEVVMIDLPRSGSVPQSRISGMLAGLHETLHDSSQWRATRLNGDGQFGAAMDCMRKFLRTSKSKRFLVGASTDPSALGALRAFQEAGRVTDCAVVGQNAEPDGRAELREPNTRLIGSVAYFPERYGAGVIRLALDIVAGKSTPPAVFMKHQLVTPDTVDAIYPNDALMGLGQRSGFAGALP